MSCHHQKLSGSQIEISCQISAEEFSHFEKEAAREFAETVEIKGFRKEHIPPDIISQHISQDKLLRRAAEMAVQKVYPEYVLGQKLDVIGPPEVTILKLASGNPLEFKVKVATVPEVKLGDYRKTAHETQKERKAQRVSEEEIRQALAWLQDTRTTTQKVDRPAKEGDKIEIDFEGKKDGVTLEKLTSRSHPIILGQTKLIPGLGEALIGLKEGEEKIITLTLPQDFSNQILQGATIQLKVRVNMVEERKIPELNDELAKSLGKFSSLADVRESIQNGLQQEKEIKEKDRLRALMVERIADESTIEVPEVLIESELDKMAGELSEKLNEMGLEITTYLQKIGKSLDKLREDWRKDARRRVRMGLVLREMGKHEGIEASEGEIKARINEYLKAFSSVNEAREKIDLTKLREYTKGALRNEKMLEFLEKQ